VIPQDKLIHFLGGFGVCSALTMRGYPMCGLEVAVVIGVGKEIWDHYHPPHVADFNDAAATILGGVLSFMISQL